VKIMSKKETTPSSKVKLATGQAINELAIMVKHRFDEVDKRFYNVETRLIRIEGKTFNHENRIEKLEDEVIDIKGLLVIK